MEITVTKEQVDAALAAIYSKPQQPTVFVVPVENAAVMRICIRGKDEGWDWRRIKRECRKGSASRYRGGPFANPA
jgi:hypothetical protein